MATLLLVLEIRLPFHSPVFYWTLERSRPDLPSLFSNIFQYFQTIGESCRMKP